MSNPVPPPQVRPLTVIGTPSLRVVSNREREKKRILAVTMANICTVMVTLLAGLVGVEGLLLKGGKLQADQESEAYWDQSSNQWVLRLTCGSFSFQGSPPLNVTWTTPLGEARFSSGYDEGRFYLNLDAPVQGGNYSCAIPSEHLPLVCEDGESNPDESDASAEVNVDELKARLTLAEANQKMLQEMLEEMKQGHAVAMANLTQFCQGIQEKVEEHQEILEEIQEALGQEGQGGSEEDSQEESQEDSQEEDLSGPCASDMHSEIDDLWRSVSEVLGEWDDYNCDRDLEHGWYRFYLNGSNAVIPTDCVEDHHCETHAPQWLDLQGQSLPAVGQEVDARACANWDGNCCNWESPITVRNCGQFYVYHLQPRDTCYLAYCAEPQ